MRSPAKLLLNSFWGKFVQRSSLTQTTLTDIPAIFTDMMASVQQEVKTVCFINDSRLQIDWIYNTDFIEASCRTNTVIAAYMTAQARLTLYSYLQPLDRRVLYCDTDSIVFTKSPGQGTPPFDDYLEDLMDEKLYYSLCNWWPKIMHSSYLSQTQRVKRVCVKYAVLH